MSTIKTGTTLTTAYQVEADTTGNLVIATGTSANVALTVNSSGNIGLGVTPSAWNTNYRAIQVKSASLYQGANNTEATIGANHYVGATNPIYLNSNFATSYTQVDGKHLFFTAPSGTAGNTITFGDAKMTLDASGNLGVGTASPVARINGEIPSVSSTKTEILRLTDATLCDFKVLLDRQTTLGNSISRVNTAAGIMAFETSNTERARIDSLGRFMVGATDSSTSDTVAGVYLFPVGVVQGTRSSNASGDFGRLVDDGDIVVFRQAGTTEGSVSVSGNTISYNAFAGSHWSQLQDGSKPDILRGTVMESINELCVWPGESNERLPKCKISDTAGSKKVYGVFMAWDNDWTTTNDMYVTAVGAFICRVNGSVTVQEGDLLESNGDGTARVQADDIIRSSTIGKVTSTVKTHEYDDGSYCVPAVLYCG